MLKKNARHQAQIAQQNHLQAIADFQKSIANTHQRLMTLAASISETMPAVIAKPVNFVLTNVVGKVLNFVQNIPNIIAKYFAGYYTKNLRI